MPMTTAGLLACAAAVAMFAAGVARAQVVPAPIPPPPNQIRADCVSPTYASDMMVCGSPDLMILDEQMASLLTDRPPASPLSVEPQFDWFRRSRRCASQADQFACLRAAYRERIALLRVLKTMQPDALAWQPCEGGRERAAAMDGGVIALSRDGQVHLGLAATELASWTPWLSARRAGRRIEFRWLDGRTFNCRTPAR